jgi:hypothetical protein
MILLVATTPLTCKHDRPPFFPGRFCRLLQQSLGGNSRTSLVVNVPPGYDVLGESHCSLLFAQRAMKVAVVARYIYMYI